MFVVVSWHWWPDEAGTRQEGVLNPVWAVIDYTSIYVGVCLWLTSWRVTTACTVL